MQNVYSVTTQEVWTLETNNGLLRKPQPWLKQKGVA